MSMEQQPNEPSPKTPDTAAGPAPSMEDVIRNEMKEGFKDSDIILGEPEEGNEPELK